MSPGGVERALQTPGGKRILTTLLEPKAQVENKKTSCSAVLSGQGLALQSMDPKVLASQLNEILAQAHTLNAPLAEELRLVLEHGFEGDSSSLENWIQTESFQKILFENSIDGQWVGDSKGASRWVSYEEARKYIQGETIDETPINTIVKFHKWSKSGKRPPNFPSNPWGFYADKGWVNWFHFLGKTPRNPTGQWMSYEEARRYIQRETIEGTPISTLARFRQWSKSGKRPPNFPANPWNFYADKGWVDGFHFLGKTPRNPTGQWMSYEEARRYIQGETIEGTPINAGPKFEKWSKSGKRPPNFPANPWVVYADKGWVDWFHFLGKTPRNPTGQWMSYEEARRYIQGETIERTPINDVAKFQKWSKSGKRPSNFPSDPFRFYAGKGWVDWFHFLGKTPRNPTGQWMSYEEARRYIQGETIEGTPINVVAKFKQWSQSGKRPSNFPAHPWTVYAGKGWVDWFHFLGTPRKTPRAPRISKTIQWMSYEEAKQYIQSIGLKEDSGILNRTDFWRWSRSEKRPAQFPAIPELTYKDEWEGWDDFLGLESAE